MISQNKKPSKSLNLKGFMAETVGFEPTQLFRVDGLAIRTCFYKKRRFPLILCALQSAFIRKLRIFSQTLEVTKWAQSSVLKGSTRPERCVFNKNIHLVRSGTLFKPTHSLCFLEKVSHFFRASQVCFGGAS